MALQKKKHLLSVFMSLCFLREYREGLSVSSHFHECGLLRLVVVMTPFSQGLIERGGPGIVPHGHTEGGGLEFYPPPPSFPPRKLENL